MPILKELFFLILVSPPRNYTNDYVPRKIFNIFIYV